MNKMFKTEVTPSFADILLQIGMNENTTETNTEKITKMQKILKSVILHIQRLGHTWIENQSVFSNHIRFILQTISVRIAYLPPMPHIRRTRPTSESSRPRTRNQMRLQNNSTISLAQVAEIVPTSLVTPSLIRTAPHVLTPERLRSLGIEPSRPSTTDSTNTERLHILINSYQFFNRNYIRIESVLRGWYADPILTENVKYKNKTLNDIADISNQIHALFESDIRNKLTLATSFYSCNHYHELQDIYVRWCDDRDVVIQKYNLLLFKNMLYYQNYENDNV